MNKLYVFREWCDYHVGFFNDAICVAPNIDAACEIIVDNLYYGKYTNRDDGISIIKEQINEFDLEIGLKKFRNKK